MREAHRLCNLQMGETRHDGVRVMRSEANDGSLQRVNESAQLVYGMAQIQTHISRHLVVA